MPLSREALTLLTQLFSETGNLQLPVAVAAQVVEIRAWLQGQTDMVTKVQRKGTP